MLSKKYVIKRTGKVQHTPEYFTEQKKLKERQKANCDLIPHIVKSLEIAFGHPVKFKEALCLADRLSQLIHIKIDRGSKRFKDHLICWYCENWETIKTTLNSYQKQREYLVDNFTFDEVEMQPDISPDVVIQDYFQL